MLEMSLFCADLVWNGNLVDITVLLVEYDVTVRSRGEPRNGFQIMNLPSSSMVQ
jgi:hypothetical protein